MEAEGTSRKFNVGPVSLALLVLAVLGASALMWGGLDILPATQHRVYSKAGVGAAYPPLEGTLVVLNGEKGVASILSLTSWTSVGEIVVGAGHRDIAVSPNGTKAMTCRFGGGGSVDNSLTMVDLARQRVRQRVSLGEYRRPYGVVWLDDEHVAVGTEAPPAVLVVDVATGKIDRTLTPSHRSNPTLSLSSDRKVIYSASATDEGLEALFLRQAKTAKLPSLPPSTQIAPSPDGSTLWLSNDRKGSVSVVDAGNLELLKTLPCPGSPSSIAVTPDSETVLVAHPKSGEVAFLDNWTQREVKRLRVTDKPVRGGAKSGASSINIHPSGKCAYISIASSGQIAVLDIKTRSVIGKIECGQGVDSLAHTPLEPLEPAI